MSEETDGIEKVGVKVGVEIADTNDESNNDV